MIHRIYRNPGPLVSEEWAFYWDAEFGEISVSLTSYRKSHLPSPRHRKPVAEFEWIASQGYGTPPDVPADVIQEMEAHIRSHPITWRKP